MIIDHKSANPPPSYASLQGLQLVPATGFKPTLATIPPHIILQIVYSTFPQLPSADEGKIERQRKTLLWLVKSLRLVNRSLYIACMHVLRSTYLPIYQSLIRSPYTSDPFPTTTFDSNSPTSFPESSPVVQSLQRETTVLDHFIGLKVREDVFSDDSEYHIERESMFKDLFYHAQPKARLEDLVRQYGLVEGVISVPGLSQPGTVSVRREGSTPSLTKDSHSSPSTSSVIIPISPSTSKPQSTASRFFSSFSMKSKNKTKSNSPYLPSTPQPPPKQITPIPFSSISISLTPRMINLVVGSGSNRRTMVQVDRGRDERLEVGAKILVNDLKDILLENAF